MKKKTWIAWERHRRTLELNKAIGADLYIFQERWPRILKHPFFVVKTWMRVHRDRPEILIVQNPSVILALLACLLKTVYGFRLVVDAHNAAIQPEGFLPKKLRGVYDLVQKKADVTIVTNDALASIVKRNGGFPFVLPDRIPEHKHLKLVSSIRSPSVLYVCTFHSDEPYLEVLDAAADLKSVSFYITGNYRKIKKIKRSHGRSFENVFFLGFIPDSLYWKMLGSVDVIIDLTLRDNCLVCGAYEAVATGTPLVLSNTTALKRYFYKGVVFADTDVKSISVAISKALNTKEQLKKEIAELKEELTQAWHGNIRELLLLVS